MVHRQRHLHHMLCFTIIIVLITKLSVSDTASTGMSVSSRSPGGDASPNSDSQYYIAATLEHVPHLRFGTVTREQALQVMNLNLDVYEAAVKNATIAGAQLIVFPEDGLYGPAFTSRDQIFPYLEFIPNVQSGISETFVTPCGDATFDDRPILQRASCMAQKYSIWIVMNMGDLQPCSQDTAAATDRMTSAECPSDGRRQYNTQVAFSDTGELVAKYHKYNLYAGEIYWDRPLPDSSDVAYFRTSFGVTFGIFICFDVMFPFPQVQLEQLGIRDFVFPSWWVNLPPWVTSLQVHQGWSLVHDSNLIASGIGMSYYNSGSGIYSRGTALASFYNPTMSPQSQLLVAQLPVLSSDMATDDQFLPGKHLFIPQKIVGSLDPRDLIHSLHPRSSVIEKRFVPSSSGTMTLSSFGPANLTCELEYSLTTSSPSASPSGDSPSGEVYGLVAFDGMQNGMRLVSCGIMRCPDNDPNVRCIDSVIQQANTTFASFALRAVYDTQSVEDMQSLPLVATSDMQIVPLNSFEFATNETNSEVSSLAFDQTLVSAVLWNVLWNATTFAQF